MCTIVLVNRKSVLQNEKCFILNFSLCCVSLCFCFYPGRPATLLSSHCIEFVLLRFSGECPLREVAGNDRQFMLGNETMDCAPGTMFNLSLCTCARYEPCKCYY